MTKKDIVIKISDETGIKQVDVKKVVQKTFDCIVESLTLGEKVELHQHPLLSSCRHAEGKLDSGNP